MFALLFALLFAACTPPADVPDSPRLSDAPIGVLGAFDLELPLDDHLRSTLRAGPRSVRDLPLHRGPSPHARPVPDLMQGAYAAVEAELDLTLGAALVDRVARLPDPRRELGLSGLTSSELFAMCESPRARTSIVAEDGTPWEAELELFPFIAVADALAAVQTTLSQDCRDDLDALPLDEALDAGRCDEGLDHHFWPGSSCHACLEAGDTWTDCTQAEQCWDEVPRRYLEASSASVSYGYVQARTLGCAPDFVVDNILLFRLHDARPVDLEAFAYDQWASSCIPLWNAAAGETSLACNSGDLGRYGDLLGAGVTGRAHTVRPVGEPRTLHQGRLYWTPTLQLGPDFTLEATWLDYGTLGSIASPIELDDFDQDGDVDVQDALYTPPSWGLVPSRLRAGGTDPSNPDDTYAREFLGAMAIKSASAYDGVAIAPFVFNRCSEQGWEPLPDGRSRCVELGDFDLDPALMDDGFNSAWQTEPGRWMHTRLPITTLASTGLPDPTVPGRLLVDVKGSTALAMPGWEDCAWPQQFEPDLSPYDATPLQFDGRTSPLMGQTYRFGREADGEAQVRIALNTTTIRDFCPQF